MDPELVIMAQHGDQEAFETLATIAHPRLYRVALGVLADAGTADDATQQALVTIWRDLPSLRDPNRFGGPSDRTAEIQAHADAGCVFYVGSGAEADGTPVYYLHGG